MFLDIIKIACFSFIGIFYKKFNKKARKIILDWKPQELKRNLIFLSLFYILTTFLIVKYFFI
jgi:predicted transporter